jgi:hypothetical protein
VGRVGGGVVSLVYWWRRSMGRGAPGVSGLGLGAGEAYFA